MRQLRALLSLSLFWAMLCLPAFAGPGGGEPVQASPAGAGSSSQIHQQPITTGSPTEKMDAGESNAEEEAYRHSSTVQVLARVLHVSVERAAQLFEDFNSGLLILAIGYFVVKFLPKAFRTRREKITRDLADARSATAMANQRLQAVEARLGALDAEIEIIREHAARDSEADQKRIEASLEAERARIIRSAEQEIGAAQAAAQRELKRFAADLAVERAISQIRLSDEDDRALVHDFTENLGARLHAGDFKKGGQN